LNCAIGKSENRLQMTPHIAIGKHSVGPSQPVYIVAELSANHNQDYDRAVRTLQAAKEAGADAVKLQTYTPDTITIRSDREYFRIGGGTLWDGRSLYDLYGEAYTPWEWQPNLKRVADDLKIDLFSTPFDPTAVDFLEKMDVPAYKLASSELVDLPLIRKIAQTGKPLIISTGMARLEEIDEALDVARTAGATQIALLKCTSAYPASPDEMNLRTITEMVRRYKVPVGLSDHSMSIAVPVAAVALGASIIEKHITLSRSEKGPDSAFSLEPDEFKFSAHEESSRVLRRSLFVVQDVKSGEVFTHQNVRSIRPGHGLHTRHLPEILGKRAACDVERGTPMSWDLLNAN